MSLTKRKQAETTIIAQVRRPFAMSERGHQQTCSGWIDHVRLAPESGPRGDVCQLPVLARNGHGSLCRAKTMGT